MVTVLFLQGDHLVKEMPPPLSSNFISNYSQTSPSFDSTAQSSSSYSHYSHSYPFIYEDTIEAEEAVEDEEEDYIETETETVTLMTTPRIGAKVDEFFDSYFEDALFRCFYPQPLRFSPLSIYFSGGIKKSQFNFPSGFITRSIFSKSVNNPLQPHPPPPPPPPSLLDWSKLFHYESMLDAGLSAPSDFIFRPQLGHRQNRRTAYDTDDSLDEFKSLKMISKSRIIWRYFCHFSIYFIKGMFAGFGMFATEKYFIPLLFDNK